MSIGVENDKTIVRQRTLTELRWVAIIGQLLTVLLAIWVLDLRFNHVWVLVCIACWTAINLAQQSLTASRLRIGGQFLLIALFFDLMELTAVLYFTGGVNNPFIVLLVVPVALGATVLSLPALWALVASNLFSILLLSMQYQMVFQDEVPILLPHLLAQGMMIASIVLTIFLTMFLRRLSEERIKMTRALAASELALQRERKLSSLGALTSAYAHELGTPLATIRMAAGDLLTQDLDDAAKADVEDILTQAKRSAEILQNMGQRGKEDELMKTLLLSALIEEAADPHRGRGKQVHFQYDLQDEIYVARSEAIIQGLRNVIQNAVDFAKSEVIVTLEEKRGQLILRVLDDGKGFPVDLLGKLGEPYLRSVPTDQREGYRGMGLGVFIAKTLLERSGAKVQFANRPLVQGSGAVVHITWLRSDLEIPREEALRPLGENREFEA